MDKPKKRPKNPDVIGYCNPPPETRFQSGVCPNLKGRPKGSKNKSMELVIEEKLAAKVTVRRNGRVTKIPKSEAGIEKMVNRFAESGDSRELKRILEIAPNALRGAAEVVLDHLVKDQSRANETAVLDWFKAAIIEEHEQRLKAALTDIDRADDLEEAA